MYSFILLVLLVMCDCTSVSYHYNDIATKLKVELWPIHITCSLNDIVVLTTPVVNCEEVLYHLHKPNGQILRIDFSGPKSKFYKFSDTNSIQYEDYNPLPNKFIVKYINEDIKAVYPRGMYKIISVSQADDKDDPVSRAEKEMNENDFMVGPLLEEDHGNWMLSVYCKDKDGEWVEMFQVITVTLITSVPMAKPKVTLREGSTFNISFKYPIKDLETCELTVPAGSPDRYFDRNRIELNKCGYAVPNITKHDHGTWKVIGVGKIVYEGTVVLNVIDDKTQEHDLWEEYKDISRKI